MHPRIMILLSFALGMSSVGISYFISGQFWRKWLFKGRSTSRSVRAKSVLSVSSCSAQPSASSLSFCHLCSTDS
jgi:hypothetical protein